LEEGEWRIASMLQFSEDEKEPAVDAAELDSLMEVVISTGFRNGK
jgi:hypothetical protein